jgi:hypothetical protein
MKTGSGVIETPLPYCSWGLRLVAGRPSLER